MLLTLVGLLVLGLVGVAGVASYQLMVEGGESSTSGERPGSSGSDDPAASAVQSDFLGQPATTWTLSAEEISPGATFGSEDSSLGGPISPPAIVGDIAVVPTSTTLAGIDTLSGDVVWTQDFPGGTCTANATTVFCLGPATSEDFDTPVLAMDPETGEILARSRTINQMAMAADDTGVYLLGGFDTDYAWAPGIRKLGPDLRRVWERTYDGVDMSDDGSKSMVVVDGVLVANVGPSMLIDTATGASTAPVTGGPADPRGFVLQSLDDGTTNVLDTSGNTILRVTDDVWGLGAGLLGAGDSVYDLSTGSVIWSDAALASTDPSFTGDGRNVVAPASDGGWQVFDSETGDALWQSSAPSDGTWAPAAYLATDSSEVSALDRADGEPAWTAPLTGDTSETPRISLARQAVVVETSDVLNGYADFDDSAGGDDGGTTYVTDCGTPPEFVPVTAVDAYGGLTITYRVTATCPGGQWLNDSAVTVDLLGDGDVSTFAAGSFDFSDTPYWIPSAGDDDTDGDSDGGVELDLTYSTRYATTDDIQQAIDDDVVRVDCQRDASSKPGVVPADTDQGTPADQPAPADPVRTPEDQDAALDALKRIARADADTLDADFTQVWSPQLSSKEKGTVDDGIVYDYDDILAEHLRLRARFPDVRLLFSSDWKAFAAGGYWVTMVGRHSDSWPPTAQWCVTQGFDTDHCAAKYLTREGGYRGKSKTAGDL